MVSFTSVNIGGRRFAAGESLAWRPSIMSKDILLTSAAVALLVGDEPASEISSVYGFSSSLSAISTGIGGKTRTSVIGATGAGDLYGLAAAKLAEGEAGGVESPDGSVHAWFDNMAYP